MRYPPLPASRVALEEQVLDTWREEDTFRRTLEATRDGEQFVFYEGPPTANGRPGLHHIISRAIKDLVCRYQTMLGKHVTRIAGWDTHGLPVEIEAQKRLGIEDKKEIEKRGIAWFNERCRESVFTYKDEWERFSERIGYWLDYSRPYVTFHAEYVESVWWLLKQMADRGLLYRGHKVVPWCPRDQTVLSSHELSLGYRDVEDPSLWVTLELLDGSGRHLLVWTTTPWTLVSNVALAVHPGIEYVEVEHEGRVLIVARGRAEALFGEERIGGRVEVDELVGARYRRPFELIPASEARGRAWEIVPGDFVSDEEGSGIVHMAPAYGADDYQAGKDFGLAVLEPVRTDGTFAAHLPLVGGIFFKDADGPLVEDLEARGLVFRATREVHSYPHCWRCDTPLVYMARHSWFARTSSLRRELLDNNAQVTWHPPEVGAGRFGEWLKGNVDWALSRDRYWGTPLPVWVSEDDPDNVEWIGSFAELAERAGDLGDDFDPHRPFIDEVTWRCPETGSVMRRAPEVIDVWFDSGAMPWAQWHYPFENREMYGRHFPADFICEAVDQTRGWFYSLHAISTMLGLGPVFLNVIVNDMILDAAGRKMSKSRGNVVDPWDAVADHGADGVRWYMITVSNPWLPTRFDSDGVKESAARFFDTLQNIYRFFALYANVEEWGVGEDGRAAGADGGRSAAAGGPDGADEPEAGADARTPLDRWLLSRLHTLVGRVREELDGYNPTRAYRAVAAFVDGELSNWYVRRARPRFWGNTDPRDADAAFSTLHEALSTVALLIAPVTPFISDWLHRALTGRSSHTEPFPEADPARIDGELEGHMADVRSLSTLARAAREEVRIRVRQPLGRMLAVVPGAAPADDVLALLIDEINVKKVEFAATSEGLVTLAARPVFRALGRRFGKLTPEAAARIRELGEEEVGVVRGGGVVRIEVGGGVAEVGGDEMEVVEEARGGWVVRSEGRYTVALDPALDERLRREGLARELVNRVQRLRRDSGLEITDRIRLVVSGTEAVCTAARVHKAAIARETLAVEVGVGSAVGEECAVRKEVEVDGEAAVLGLSRQA
ncbi:MAG: isoleucine--tRNA ligase [Gemmatimonadota bacterium]|nr:isoleucine--tRNA ligase [Gemmatimonadota bacterium]